MLIEVNAKDLEKAAVLAARAASGKNPREELEGLLIETDGEKIVLRCFDTQKGIRVVVNDVKVKAEGKILINARRFCEVLHSVPNGVVKLSSDKATARLAWGKSHFDIPIYDAAAAPEWPEAESEMDSFEVNQDLLSEMIQKTGFCFAKDNTRPVFTGVCFEKVANELNLVALDGYRMARAYANIEGSDKSMTCIVPGVAMGDIQKMCDEASLIPAKISIYPKHVVFDIGDSTLLIRKLEGTFMDFRKTIPNSFEHDVSVQTAAFSSVAGRALLATDVNNAGSPIVVDIGEGEMKISVATIKGCTEDYVDIEGNGENLVIGLNPKYLLEGLKACNTGKVRFKFSAPTKPTVLESDSEAVKFVYLLLPVRLHQQ